MRARRSGTEKECTDLRAHSIDIANASVRAGHCYRPLGKKKHKCQWIQRLNGGTQGYKSDTRDIINLHINSAVFDVFNTSIKQHSGTDKQK